jgi:ferric-dicitrate binding protein FerR (iron transport regulator)
MDFLKLINYLKQSELTSGNEEVKNWLTDPENERQAREMLGSVWTENQISLKKGSPDLKKMLDQIHHQINMNRSAQTVPLYKRKAGRPVPVFYRIAAILLIPLLIASSVMLVSIYNFRTDPMQYTEKELFTKPGTRIKIQLEDGTRVWLNDGTKIRYPEKFASGERHVFLDGEAYFEVTSNPEKPFIVENPMVKTVVTGTSFNIRGYSSDHYFEATLSNGEVQLMKDNREIRMLPGQQVQYNNRDDQFFTRKVDPAIYSSWIEGRLILKDESFSVAMLKLSRWYNADIMIQDKALKDYLLTATIENEKIEQTLEHIAYALPVKYRIEKQRNSENAKTTVYMMKK